jgi:DNA-binding winged helix-turn-helix (wHTH) protein
MQPTVDFLPHVPISLVQRRLLNKLIEAGGNVVPHDELVKLWPDGYTIVSHRGLGYSIAEKTKRRKKKA